MPTAAVCGVPGVRPEDRVPVVYERYSDAAGRLLTTVIIVSLLAYALSAARGKSPISMNALVSGQVGEACYGDGNHRDLIYVEMACLIAYAEALDFAAVQWRKVSKFCEAHGERDRLFLSLLLTGISFLS